MARETMRAAFRTRDTDDYAASEPVTWPDTGRIDPKRAVGLRPRVERRPGLADARRGAPLSGRAEPCDRFAKGFGIAGRTA